jgi:hypothetical protein
MAKKATGRKRAAKRELIKTRTDKRYIKRRGSGRFKESDDVGRHWPSIDGPGAKRKVASGQGDKGDRDA